MVIGVPKEIKDHETRVGLVPSGVIDLHEAGHRILVESGAGEGSSITDVEYQHAGAEIVAAAGDVWGRADLIVKVKEPQQSEYGFLRPDLILFTRRHLQRKCSHAGLERVDHPRIGEDGRSGGGRRVDPRGVGAQDCAQANDRRDEAWGRGSGCGHRSRRLF